MAGAERLKRQILITSNGLDFPRGFAPNAQGKEIGQALINLGFDPVLIPQKLSSYPEGEATGDYFGIRYDYLSSSRKFPFCERTGILRKLAGLLYSVVASCRLALHLVRNRKTVAAVFDLTNQTLPLLIEGTACRVLGIPLVYFLWEEVCAHRVNRQTNQGLKWMHRLITWVEAPLLYGIALRLPRRITYLTDEARDYLKKWGYPDATLVDLPVVKYRKQEREDRTPSTPALDLVFTGTINTEKDDFLSVVEAIAVLKDEQPDLRLRIYGSSEGTAEEEILSAAESYGVRDRIEFMGWYKLEDLDVVRRQALALLVLKKDTVFNRYNFPSRILDFLDSGRPLLISDLSAHTKYFRDRDNAFVIEEGNVEALVGSIKAIIDDPDLVDIMTRAASGLLDDRFDACKNLKMLLSSLKLVHPSNDSTLI